MINRGIIKEFEDPIFKFESRFGAYEPVSLDPKTHFIIFFYKKKNKKEEKKYYTK